MSTAKDRIINLKLTTVNTKTEKEYSTCNVRVLKKNVKVLSFLRNCGVLVCCLMFD